MSALFGLVMCCAGAMPVVPFDALLARPVRLREAVRGAHPRLFFTSQTLPALRERARGPGASLWRDTVRAVRALSEDPPQPGSSELDKSGVQNQTAYTLATVVFAYAIEQDRRYLEAARRWLASIIRYDPWGYTYRTPNVDLPPAHLLYAVAFAYDTLYDDLSREERKAVRAKLAHQAQLMYDHFAWKPGRRYSFSQNHTFVPMTGLAIAAFALLDEEPDAVRWAQLARAIYDRTLTVFGTDGYYYEGFQYAVYSLHWIVRFMDALTHVTGEDLYPRMRDKFVPFKYYWAHSVLPDGKAVFDFGDTGQGASSRKAHSRDPLNSGYEALYSLAARYRDAELQAVAEWLRVTLKTTTYEPHWAFYAYDPHLRASPIASIARWHWFRNSDTLYWRSGWDTAATAIAFRCAPPEGHHTAALLKLVPEWRLSTGHAHPDAGSFIVFANGRYLTGDSGYTGVKLTAHHNTLLFNGRGQNNDGRHETFKDVPYEKLGRIRIVAARFSANGVSLTADATAAYDGVDRFVREFRFTAPRTITVIDDVATPALSTFTWLLHAADPAFPGLKIEHLHVEAVTAMEPNMVIAQGPAGAVEKGRLEQRGVRLAETFGPAIQARIVHVLTIED